MIRYVLTYGLIAGLVAISVMLTGIELGGNRSVFASMAFGYGVMLVALTLIFVAVKRYRDVERGGVIGFGAAFGLGLAIAAVAGVAYVAISETWLALTHYAYIDHYIDGVMAARRAEGASPAALAREAAELETMRGQFANPLFRVPMTFMEIFPVGLLVALLSALLLRKPGFMPAQR